MEQSQNVHKKCRRTVSNKLPWVSPSTIAINTNAIQQQEDEVMQLLLSDPDSFRLLTGSAPPQG